MGPLIGLEEDTESPRIHEKPGVGDNVDVDKIERALIGVQAVVLGDRLVLHIDLRCGGIKGSKLRRTVFKLSSGQTATMRFNGSPGVITSCVGNADSRSWRVLERLDRPRATRDTPSR